jgi:hypothetical protein
MGTYRMYTGDDGETHWETVELDKTPQWTCAMGTSHIVFRTDPVGSFMDWHPAPRRQFVIILSGQLEIGFSDGTTKVFGAGDARLVEDTTGKGHTTGVYGDEPVVVATIPLQEER